MVINMSRLIEIPLDNDTKIYLETCGTIDTSDDLIEPVSGNRIIHETREFLSGTFEQIKLFSSGLAESIKGIDMQPDEFEVEFSVKFSANAGIIISSLNSEASMTIRMKWEKAGGT